MIADTIEAHLEGLVTIPLEVNCVFFNSSRLIFDALILDFKLKLVSVSR